MHVTICPVTDLTPGSSATSSDGTIVVFNVDGELFALDNRCAHKQQPLADGVVRDGIVTCPAHLWRYDVATGDRTDARGFAVASHPVTVSDGQVAVEVPDLAPERSMRELMLDHAREWRRDG
jgi:nitrite reductase/ring-hydroxylating ferredoxin subunit